jgi:toxin-antitoxin system PIN domain toxin
MTYIFDSNILIYLAFKGAKEHLAARNVTDRVFTAQEIVILTEAIILSFLRISTSLKPNSLTEKEARVFLDALLEYPHLQLFAPSVRHYKNLTANLVGQKIKGNLVMDAHIAEVALLTNSMIITNDDDFKKFPRVKFLKI